MTNLEATKEMCYLCFNEITKKFQKVPKLEVDLKKMSAPLFVTWEKKNRKNEYRLQGCIGTFQSSNLSSQLPKYAKTSAFDDSRFDPVQKRDLVNLQCTVSVLTNFEAASSPTDWEVGKHGIEINIPPYYSATFLPEVAEEQNWDKETTLLHLIRKSGYRGKIDNEFMSTIKTKRYQSSVCNCTWDEYNEYIQTLEK
ncbi:ammecr1 [Anaeramoeba flamelloides]|uniref:Ammecr1 n=1 Tax=Anaeramoeba flamelloides TaxID=1746091 RepID=A0ABQ8YXH6_9EUKA|nr:ammecr1 [Anaeramoeba flamelloides]